MFVIEKDKTFDPMTETMDSNFDYDKFKDALWNVAIAGALTGLAYISYRTYKEYRSELDRARKEFEEEEQRRKDEIAKELDDIQKEEERKEAIPEAEEYVEPTQEEVALDYYDRVEVDLGEGRIRLSDYKAQLELDDINTEEEVETLKHDINSQEAISQYREMLTAEIRDEKVLSTLWELWSVPFKPKSEKDKILLDSLIFDRVDFFSADSQWVNRVSFAEVVLHFAQKAQFDLDYSVELSVKAWLYHLGLYPGVGAYTVDKAVRDAVDHDIITPDNLYSMFGLDDDAYLDMLGHLDHEKDSSFDQEYNTWIYFESGVL